MIKTNVDTTDVLMKILQDGTIKVIEKQVQEYVEDACKQLHDRIPEIMSTIALQIWKCASLERFGHDLKITVDLKGGDGD